MLSRMTRRLRSVGVSSSRLLLVNPVNQNEDGVFQDSVGIQSKLMGFDCKLDYKIAGDNIVYIVSDVKLMTGISNRGVYRLFSS